LLGVFFIPLLCRIILDEAAHDVVFMFCPVNAQMVCSLLIWWSYSTQHIPLAFKEILAMKINERAPIITSYEIEVAADASIIWEIMPTIDRWPK